MVCGARPSIINFAFLSIGIVQVSRWHQKIGASKEDISDLRLRKQDRNTAATSQRRVETVLSIVDFCSNDIAEWKYLSRKPGTKLEVLLTRHIGNTGLPEVQLAAFSDTFEFNVIRHTASATISVRRYVSALGQIK